MDNYLGLLLTIHCEHCLSRSGNNYISGNNGGKNGFCRRGIISSVQKRHDDFYMLITSGHTDISNGLKPIMGWFYGTLIVV